MTQPPLITRQRWDEPLAPLPPQEAPTLPAQPQTPPAVRRSSRLKQPPKSHEDYIRSDQTKFFVGVLEEGGEQLTYEQASKDPQWIKAMQSQCANIMKNHIWSLVKPPLEVRPITARWLYKIKPGVAGGPVRYKARIVAWEFSKSMASISRRHSLQWYGGNPSEL